LKEQTLALNRLRNVDRSGQAKALGIFVAEPFVGESKCSM